MMYICKSSYELHDEQMRELARGLRCAISYVGKAMEQKRWDYKLEKDDLQLEDRQLIIKYGLEIVIGDWEPSESNVDCV